MFRFTFALDLFTGSAASRDLSHQALARMLECLTDIDTIWLRAHPEAPNLYDSHVYYQEEPPGQEDWQDIPTCLSMGFGDCEDLACWRAAELRVRHGIDARPVFTHTTRPDGGSLYHILVRYPDGRIEDPSRRRGMQ